MANRIFYASLGLLLDVPFKNTNITNYFLSGVQSVGIDTEMPTVSFPSIGKFIENSTLKQAQKLLLNFHLENQLGEIPGKFLENSWNLPS